MWGVVVGDSSATSRSPRSSGRSYKSSLRGTASTCTSSLLEVLRWQRAAQGNGRYIGRHPFYNFYRLRPSYRDLLVDRRTQIVIEGFPRSGNTFAVVAFQQAQRESVRVAHHLHMPAQVVLAAQWGILTLLLARKPTDAALSWVIRQPGVLIRQALKHYISFYEKAAEYRDALVVGLFEEVTRDYGRVWSGSMPSSAPGSRASFTPKTTSNASSTV